MINVPFTPTALRLFREYVEQLEAHTAVIRDEADSVVMPEPVAEVTPAEEVAETAPPAPPAPPAPVAQPDPVPQPVYELQPTQKCVDSGYTLEQYRANGWSDEQLEAGGLAAWVEVEAPFTDAPGASNAPPPPPVAAAPAAPATSVQLDKNGLPWDARIHSDAAEKLSAKGEWKRRRNVSDALIAQVEAELRAALGGAAPKPAATPTPTAAAASPSGVQNFAELSVYIASLLKAGKITQADTVEAVKSVGLQILPDMANPANAQHIPAVVAFLRQKAGL